MASKKSLRRRKSVNIAASLLTSGVGKANISKLSEQTLSASLSKMRKNSPMAKKISAELAGRTPKRKKRG